MSPGNFPKLIRPLDAGELHEVLEGIPIGTPRLRTVDVGEPLDDQWNIRQAMEVGRA